MVMHQDYEEFQILDSLHGGDLSVEITITLVYIVGYMLLDILCCHLYLFLIAHFYIITKSVH